jgi:mannosyltransferase
MPEERNPRAFDSIEVMRKVVWAPLAMLALCCAVGAALRLYHLDYKSYWLDEAVSLELAREPWRVFTREIRSNETNMVLYFTALRPWVALGGGGETWVRLLSCVFGLLTLPVVYLIGTRLFDRWTGAVAAGVLAINAPHVWASQEARSYALLVLLTTTSWLLLLWAAAQRRGPRAVAAWLLYALVGGLSVYAHFYAVLVLAAQGIVLLFLPLPREPATSPDARTVARVPTGVAIACGIAFAVMVSPIALFLRHPHHNIDWISNGGRGLGATLALLGRLITHPTSSQGRNELTILAFAGPLAVMGSWRQATVRSARWRWALLLLWLCVPLVVSIAVSIVLQPMIDARYLSICLPPLALLAAGALTQLWPRWPARVLLFALVAASALSLEWYYRNLENEDWRGVTSYVLSHAEPGDYILFFSSYTRSPFDLYRHVADTTRAPIQDGHVPPVEMPRWRPLPTTIAEARTRATRLWVAFSHNATSDCEDAVNDYLRQRFSADDSLDFHLVRLRRYAEPLPSPSPHPADSATATQSCY